MAFTAIVPPTSRALYLPSIPPESFDQFFSIPVGPVVDAVAVAVDTAVSAVTPATLIDAPEAGTFIYIYGIQPIPRSSTAPSGAVVLSDDAALTGAKASFVMLPGGGANFAGTFMPIRRAFAVASAISIFNLSGGTLAHNLRVVYAVCRSTDPIRN